MSEDLITQAFGEDANLYSTVLEVSPTVTPAQLRKAYYKRALLYHPDKNQSSPVAKLKFQAISLAYEILSDVDRRKVYDETGELNEDDVSLKSGMEEWREYFQGMFPKVTMEMIDNFEKKYKGSDEERDDVIKYYRSSEGNLNEMLTCVMLSNESDKKRWVEDYINPAVKDGTVPCFKENISRTIGGEEDDDDDTVTDEEETSSNSQKRTVKSKKKMITKKKSKSRKEKEAKEAEDLFAKIRGNAMARRQQAFGNMMEGLEDRYSSGGSGGKKKNGGGKRKSPSQDSPDIPDDEFEKIQARIESNRKSSKKSSRRK